MKKLISVIMSAIILFTLCVLPSSAEAAFEDVTADDWFFGAVTRIRELKYMNGTSDTTFSPYDAISRAMAVQILYNISGEQGKYSPCFTDVPKDSWFAEAVCWARDKGIANGTSATRFSPSSLMTREQLACFIGRYIDIYGLSASDTESYGYSDMSNVSEWAVDAVSDMASYKIMTPRVYDFFYPEATVSRAEFATFVLKMTGNTDFGIDTSIHVQLIYTRTASAELEKGQSVSVEGVLYPEAPTDSCITYSSSAPAVASVDEEGNVTALSQGTARITITSRDGGFKAYSFITVSELASKDKPQTNNDTYNSSVDMSEMRPIYSTSIDPTRPMVAITYDDGPHRTYTNRILDTLEKYGAYATFFELGERAVNCPDVLKREVELGCEVANHSYDHPNLANLSASGVSGQISRTNDIIYNACGIRPTLVRPPYGSLSATAKNNLGAPAILWSIDTLDWKYRDASYVTSVIKSQVRDGSVILMHSLYSSTASATEIIVPWLLSQGYQLVTVSQLAEARGVNLENGKIYYSF